MFYEACVLSCFIFPENAKLWSLTQVQIDFFFHLKSYKNDSLMHVRDLIQWHTVWKERPCALRDADLLRLPWATPKALLRTWGRTGGVPPSGGFALRGQRELWAPTPSRVSRSQPGLGVLQHALHSGFRFLQESPKFFWWFWNMYICWAFSLEF